MRWSVLLLYAALLLSCLFTPGSGARARKVYFNDVSKQAGMRAWKGKKYWAVTLADVTRTGRYDLLLSDHNTRGIEFYTSQGSNRFQYVRDSPIKSADWHGTAAADLTGSGFPDLILTKGGGRGRKLRRPALVEAKRQGSKLDYVLTSGEGINLGQNDMRGRTARVFDIDGDGKLDVVYINAKPKGKTLIHFVYKNLGGGRFRLVRNVGFERVDAKWVLLLDANNDGHLDLLFLENKLEMWLGTGRFKFRKDNSWIPDEVKTTNAAGAAEIDYNNDGLPDLYIARGKRDGTKAYDDYLLKNMGNRYEDVSREAGIPRGGVSGHATDGDFDNNGHVDLYVSQGGKGRRRNKDWLLMNKGDGTFNIVRSHRAAARPSTQRGNTAHTFDYDMDGRTDILVGIMNGPWKLYKNSTPRSNYQWVIVRVGTLGRRRKPSLGALVTVKCRSHRVVQRVGSRGESHSQSYMDTLHFGLGRYCKNNRADFINVKYVGGGINGLRKPKVRRVVTIGAFFTPRRW